MSNDKPPRFEPRKINFSLIMRRVLNGFKPGGYNTNYANDNPPEKSEEQDYEEIAKYYYNKLDALFVLFKQGKLQLDEEEVRKLLKLKKFFDSALYIAKSDEYTISDILAMTIIDLAEDYVFQQFIKNLESRT